MDAIKEAAVQLRIPIPFLLAIVAGFVSGLGAIACGVGVLATLPLGSLMLEAAHQRVCVRPPA